MAFHHIRFPLSISLGARGGPQWATDVVELVSGAEERNARWASSKRSYDVGFGVKSKADLREIISFFEERRGSFHSFLFRDPIDHSSGNELPTASDQTIGVGDGNKTTFQLTKTYGKQFDPYVRAITKPVKGSVIVAVNGVTTAAFSVDVTLGTVRFDKPPAAGKTITAGYLFDVPVRFQNDKLDVEISNFDAAIAPTIKLVEVRG